MLRHQRILSFAAVAVLCILLGSVEAQAVIVDSNVFPVQGGTYESEGPTTVTFPGARLAGSDTDIELVSLSIAQEPNAAGPPVAPPSEGSKYQVDSFFDVFVEIHVDGASDFVIDSFFDVFTELTIDNPQGSRAGHWDTEILSMDLSSSGPIPIPGTTSTLEIRLSPTIPSTGSHELIDLGGGRWQIDSFFDVFTEISVDRGTWQPASGGIPMALIPEPATMSLLAIGGLAVLRRKR